jgi:hypothetical protein
MKRSSPAHALNGTGQAVALEGVGVGTEDARGVATAKGIQEGMILDSVGIGPGWNFLYLATVVEDTIRGDLDAKALADEGE